MSTVNLDPDVFRAPLSAEAPAGVDLQADAAGRARRSALRDLREEARRIERQSDEGDAAAGGWPAAVPLWRQIRDEAVAMLSDVSRDTSIAALLIEALARTDGFAGLAAGFTATSGMVEAGWSGLFPAPDPEDGPVTDELRTEERSMPLVRLAGLDAEGLLEPAIMRIPLTSDRGGDPLALCHYKSSRDLVNETDGEKVQLAVSRGATSPEQFAQAVAGSTVEFFRQNFADLQAARTAWDGLCAAVEEASAGAAGIPAAPIRSLLEECDAAIRIFAPQSVPAEAEPVGAGAAGASPAAAGPHADGPVANREAAFRQLEQIAGFFERNDPHSLLAAQLRNIVRLGRLPPAEYYRELIADGSAADALFKFVGLHPPRADGG
ncbi:MAG: type VI secretion system protein TssA [Planctomycetia bacterium]|nr:type VI secretion system protein TssA [Planctomycetia bacterium]